MADILHDWLSLLLRWAHIVAAIGWIGSSFYFMWLDASLRRAPGLPEGVKGENWTVHGGGFYHTRKYMVAPAEAPEALHWFRWESYATWLSGFALMATIYYWGASSYLVDPSGPLGPAAGVALSLAGLAAAWLGYDALCRSPLRARPALLFALLFALIVLATIGYGAAFSSRATFLQIGAMIATIMTGNVFLTIIPNQRIVVADLQAGRAPDPRLGEIAKLRSTHNNYLTLPVVFLMISNHYPSMHGHALAPAIVALALALGAAVRHWFNRWEAGERGPGVVWQWPAAAALALAMLALTGWRPEPPAPVAGAIGAEEALAIVAARCAGCHAARPSVEGFEAAPAGVALESLADLRAHAPRVLAQTVLSDAMPLGNLTAMTAEERARLGAWIRAGMPEG